MYYDSDASRRNLVVSCFFFLVFLIGDATIKKDGNAFSIGLLGIEIHRVWPLYLLAWVMFFWFWWRYAVGHESIIEALREELQGNSDHKIYLDKKDPANSKFDIFRGRLALKLSAHPENKTQKLNVKKGCDMAHVILPSSNWWDNPWTLQCRATLQDITENQPNTWKCKIKDNWTKYRILIACLIWCPKAFSLLFPHVFAIAILFAWIIVGSYEYLKLFYL